MNPVSLRRWTGSFGVGVVLASTVVVPLYFVYDGPPPVANVLARVLINMFACTALLGFLVGFRELLRAGRPEAEWTASLAFTTGLAFVILTFVADSIQVGAVLGTRGELDPTMIGGRGEGSLLIFGPLARLLSAAFLLAAAAAIRAAGVLPAWMARLARLVAIFHLAMVPTLFSGTLPAHFYSINGWNIPVAGGLLAAWILAASLSLLFQKG